eukprot:m.333819 g.333819  ORF g.333819 m.333819 type:complete len:127 (-) comp16067_c0_seq2:69-449(-)
MTCFPYFPVPLDLIDSGHIAAASFAIASAMEQAVDTVDATRSVKMTTNEREILLMAAYLSPLWGYITGDAKKTSHRSLVFYVLRTSLRLSKTFSEQVCHMLLCAQMFMEVRTLSTLSRAPTAQFID